MTTSTNQPSRLRAFTLIEMLVVIAVISVLAGMLIPVGSRLKIAASIKHTQAQMATISSLIEIYKEKVGQYPPENPVNSGLPSLVYELTGTELVPPVSSVNPVYTNTARNSSFTLLQLKSIGFWRGFINAGTPGSGDDSPKAKNFAADLDARYLAKVTTNGVTFEVLASPYRGPNGLPNPWNYSTSRIVTNPTHTKTQFSTPFDLWIDLRLGGTTNRICNWSSKPIKL